MQTPSLSYLIQHSPIYVKELATRALSPKVQVHNQGRLRVATERVNSEFATVGVWLHTGSRDENAQKHQLGSAFFLQNALLSSARSNIIKPFKLKTGAKFAATVDRDITSFQVRVLKEHAADAAKVLGEALNTPLTEGEYESLKPLVAASRKKINTQNRQVDQTAHEAAFHGCSLAYDPLGQEDSFPEIHALKQFQKDNFTAQRAVVVAVGDINEAKFAEAAKGLLKEGEGDGHVDHKVVYSPCEQKVWNEHLAQPSVALLYQTPGIAHPDHLVLRAWQAMFGNWTKERGFATGSGFQREVALNHLATRSDAVLYSYPEISLFGVKGDSYDITTGHDSHGSEQYLWKIMYEVNRACKLISPDDALRAKYILRSQIIDENTGVTKTADRIGRDILIHGNRTDPVITLERVDKITADDMMRVGEQWFYHRDPVYVGVGPIGYTPNYNAIRRLTYWWRD